MASTAGKKLQGSADKNQQGGGAPPRGVAGERKEARDRREERAASPLSLGHEIKLVLWDDRAAEFKVEGACAIGDTEQAVRLLCWTIP